VHSPIAAHYINAYGRDDQKQRWLPKVISGDAVLAIAMTEPGAGSVLQGTRITAVRDGSHYVINGSKTFISNGSHCDLLIIASLRAGLAESAVLEAIRYTKHREAFGKSLITFQHNRFEVAQLQADTLSIKTTVDTTSSGTSTAITTPRSRRWPS
jgi:alkylation response protein AidB-like acyl-CoA dehydrogenase